MIGIIYKVTNDINDLVYIGQTMYLLENRWEWHINKSNNIKDNCKFHKALRELGYEHFKIEEIERVSTTILDEREIYWIKYYDSYFNGYNSTLGGNGGKKLPIYTDKQAIDRIIDLYVNKHISTNKIALEYKIDKATVARILKLNNIQLRDRFQFQPTEETKNIIINAYINGTSLSKLSRQYNTTTSTIRRFLVKNNITITTKNMILRDINKCKERAEDYKTHNVNMQFTMAKYGICFQTLKTILKRFNVPIKNTNGKLKTV